MCVFPLLAAACCVVAIGQERPRARKVPPTAITPERVAATRGSYTGGFLAELLPRPARRRAAR